MRALVVGYGSIGQRHTRLLEELGCETGVVSARPDVHSQSFPTLDAALTAWQPEYVVVANETSAHYDAMKFLADAGYRGRVLIEKPLFDDARVAPAVTFSHAAVAYNLRCHPLVRHFSHALAGGRILEVNMHVGQWLPDWRPARDYRTSYSAKRTTGGGVMRDLSHELDLALHLFGPWRKLTALGGHFSDLEIDSDDAYTLLLATGRCPSVNITMNYLDRPAQRTITVNTTMGTIRLDLVNGVLEQNGVLIAEHIVERDHTYKEQHRAMIDGRIDELCSINEGLAVLDLIVAAEQANGARCWVCAE